MRKILIGLAIKLKRRLKDAKITEEELNLFMGDLREMNVQEND